MVAPNVPIAWFHDEEPQRTLGVNVLARSHGKRLGEGLPPADLD
jgi:hypothetical protein